MKVLIVDDSRLAGRHLEEMFSEFPDIDMLGQVRDGHKAMDCIKAVKPDVVILEPSLSAANGFEILRLVKEGNLASVVMVLTAIPFPEYQECCPEMVADFFFDKSREFHRVREVLADMAGSAPVAG